jgi:hypothetical protein
MYSSSKTLVASFLATSSLFISFASAAVIYQHDFSGSAGSTLNNVAIDTANSTFGGSSGATWLASENRFRADGSTTSVNATASAFIPFSPVNGYIYTISLDVEATAISSNGSRFTMSLLDYTGAGSPNVAADFQSFANHTSYGTIGLRTSDFNDSGSKYNFLSWTGPALNGASHLNHTTPGTWNLSIILNTTAANNWTVTLVGTSDTGEIQSRSGAVPSSATIDHIMLTNYQQIAVSMESFSVIAVPEPSLTLLSSISGLLAVRRNRRR